jgi:hypothetical protein
MKFHGRQTTVPEKSGGRSLSGRFRGLGEKGDGPTGDKPGSFHETPLKPEKKW